MDPEDISQQLDSVGYANLGSLLADDEVSALVDCYQDERLFRSRIDMRRYNFGEGEYKYFANPLPAKIQALQNDLYLVLVPVANTWEEQLRTDRRFPAKHESFLDRCHAAGQNRPTPLLLHYREGGYNCLHQDLYGEHVFPLQVVILLDDPGKFDGGEFVLTEQRPRMQSRVTVVPLRKGQGVVFPVNERPRAGKRGYYRARVRHGVSTIRSGERRTLGILFHDAQ